MLFTKANKSIFKVLLLVADLVAYHLAWYIAAMEFFTIAIVGSALASIWSYFRSSSSCSQDEQQASLNETFVYKSSAESHNPAWLPPCDPCTPLSQQLVDIMSEGGSSSGRVTTDEDEEDLFGAQGASCNSSSSDGLPAVDAPSSTPLPAPPTSSRPLHTSTQPKHTTSPRPVLPPPLNLDAHCRQNCSLASLLHATVHNTRYDVSVRDPHFIERIRFALGVSRCVARMHAAGRAHGAVSTATVSVPLAKDCDGCWGVCGEPRLVQAAAVAAAHDGSSGSSSSSSSQTADVASLGQLLADLGLTITMASRTDEALHGLGRECGACWVAMGGAPVSAGQVAARLERLFEGERGDYEAYCGREQPRWW